MKRVQYFTAALILLSLSAAAFSKSKLLSEYKGFWERMNHSNVHIEDSYIAFSIRKGHAIREICFAKSAKKVPEGLLVKCNPSPTAGDVKAARSALKDLWDGSRKTVMKTSVTIYKTANGISFEPKGGEYVRM